MIKPKFFAFLSSSSSSFPSDARFLLIEIMARKEGRGGESEEIPFFENRCGGG